MKKLNSTIMVSILIGLAVGHIGSTAIYKHELQKIIASTGEVRAMADRWISELVQQSDISDEYLAQLRELTNSVEDIESLSTPIMKEGKVKR